MGLLNQKKAAAPVIRREVVAVGKPKLKPKPIINGNRLHKPSSTNSLRVPSTTHRSRPTPSASPRASPGLHRQSASPRPPSSSSADGDTRDRKRKLPTSSAAIAARKHRPSPVGSDRVTFSGSESEDDNGWERRFDRKRRRRERAEDVDRVLAHKALITSLLPEERNGELKFRKKGLGPGGESKERELRIVHAADVANVKENCAPLWDWGEDEIAVELQYPGTRERERYELVFAKDKLDTMHEIVFVVKNTPDVFFDEKTAETFRSVSRRLERASSDAIRDLASFKAALADFNDRILALHTDGSISRSLAKKHDLPKDFVGFILQQVYDRTVAPKVELLKKYENGSDNVYGELLHNFVSDLLVERCQMTSSQVFVDLGSGVGNVVLQAALEIGCESWGCEMMSNACDLAEAQKKEFEARCRLWGLRHGRVNLLQNDFTAEPKVQDALKRADVVLVNNQAFTSELNDALVRMFLDLKSGCKVISLKSFVHDFKSAAYNVNNVGSSIFDVQNNLPYPKGYVSWTNSAGSFCVSTRK